MPLELLHRFEFEGKRFAIDPETCFCFECDAISWDVLDHYPHESANRIYHLLREKYDQKELIEVVGELEWLRAARSILTPPKREDALKVYEIERGLKQLTVVLQGSPIFLKLGLEQTRKPQLWKSWATRKNRAATPTEPEGALYRDAVALLLNRSGNQRELLLEFVEEGEVHDAALLGELSEAAFKAAALAGKNLAVAVRVTDIALSKAPPALEGHTIGLRLDVAASEAGKVSDHIRDFARGIGRDLGRLVKTVHPDAHGVAGHIIVQPNHPAFGDVVETLDTAGFGVIELDLDGAYVANPGIEPSAMIGGMRQTARYYAQRLLGHHYFKLEPVASLFWRVYTGTPMRRSDFAGTNLLAVDESGGIFPSRPFQCVDRSERFRVGSLRDGTIDEEALLRFDDVGALTTQACMTCWARHLCGGGSAAVHQALSGSFRNPHEAWCETQRAWMAAAIASFHELSSAGVHFERVYNALGKKEKPSLFTLARAALTMSIGVRPIEEADAEMLRKWENWNESAYFLFNESGILLATKYDREMDSLHPRGIDQELVLLRKNGEPFGLLKVRPDRFPGAAHAWLFMQDPADYASDGIRKSFRAILKEAGSQQSIRRLMIPAAVFETGLHGFLEAIGCTREGVLREALYLHGKYFDVSVYSITTER